MNDPSSVSSEPVEALITEFIRDELLGDPSVEIDSDENLLSSGLVDSVGLVRLVAHVREHLDVTVPPQDMVPENFRTIRVLADYLDRLPRG